MRVLGGSIPAMHGQRFRACTPDCRTGSPQLTGTSRERVIQTNHVEVWQWRNMQPPCWTSLKAALGRALCPTSNRRRPLGPRIPRVLTIRSLWTALKTFWVCLSFPTTKWKHTGSTAASWVCSVTAAALSAVTATSPKCSPAWRTSTPCVWPSLPASTTTASSCATCATFGICVVPV